MKHRFMGCAGVLVAAMSAVACGSDEAAASDFEAGCDDVTIGMARELEPFVALGCAKVGSLSIRMNDAEFETLKGLENLETVAGTFSLVSGSITSLDGLKKLKSVGSLYIGPAPQLVSLQALGSLASVDDLHLVRTGVETLDGLQKLRDVRRLEIAENAALTSLSPLSAWPEGTVSDAISIRGNAALAQCKVDAFFAAQAPSAEACEACDGNSAAACD